MIKIRNRDGMAIYGREEIWEVATKFYEDLYRNVNPYRGTNKRNKVTKRGQERTWKMSG